MLNFDKTFSEHLLLLACKLSSECTLKIQVTIVVIVMFKANTNRIIMKSTWVKKGLRCRSLWSSYRH